MEIKKTVELKLKGEELDAISRVYNMLYEIDEQDERALDNAIDESASLEEVRSVLASIWELAGQDITDL